MYRVLTAFTAVAALTTVTAAPSRADADSYLQALRDAGVNVDVWPFITPAGVTNHGLHVCMQLRAGITPDQIIQNDSFGAAVPVPLVIDAAQHNLCPDTLGSTP